MLVEAGGPADRPIRHTARTAAAPRTVKHTVIAGALRPVTIAHVTISSEALAGVATSVCASMERGAPVAAAVPTGPFTTFAGTVVATIAIPRMTVCGGSVAASCAMASRLDPTTLRKP